LYKSLFLAVNAIFDRVLRIAIEDTELDLIVTKCIPMYYCCTVWTFVQSLLLTIVRLISCRLDSAAYETL